MKAKFKVGDRVKLKKGKDGYEFEHTGGEWVKPSQGCILTISNVDKDGDYSCYGFKEDIDANGRAHWLYVERAFELAIPNWKKRLQK